MQMKMNFVGLATLALLISASAAHAALVDVAYEIRRPGSSGTFQPMRYTDADGNVLLLAGYSIVSTHVTVNYVPTNATELSAFSYGLAVPVTGATSNYLSLTREMLTDVGDGSYTLDLTTNDHNGTIVSSSFGYEFFGRGTYTNSFVTYTVAIPEPSAHALLTPVAGLLIRRRR